MPSIDANKIIEAVLLVTPAACGHCPLSLPCWQQRGFASLEPNIFFFECARCHAVGFVFPQWPLRLYVCTLLRNERANSQIGRTSKERAVQAQNVKNALLGPVVKFKMLPSMPRCYGDIPHGCIRRCRTARTAKGGNFHRKLLSDTVDCRTTVDNKLPCKRY